EPKRGWGSSDQDSCSDEAAPVLSVALRHQIDRPPPGHHEASGSHSAEHVVRVLPERPFVQKQTPETGKPDFAAGTEAVARRMLHPRIGCDNEISGEP